MHPLLEKHLFSDFSFVFLLLALIPYVFWSRGHCHTLSWQHCLARGGCLRLRWISLLLCRSTFVGCIPVCPISMCCLGASLRLLSPADVLKCFLQWFHPAGPWLWLLKTGGEERVAALLPRGLRGPSSAGASSRRLHQKTLELGVEWKHRHTVNYSSTLGATLIKAGPHRSQDLKFSLLQCLTVSPTSAGSPSVWRVSGGKHLRKAVTNPLEECSHPSRTGNRAV